MNCRRYWRIVAALGGAALALCLLATGARGQVAASEVAVRDGARIHFVDRGPRKGVSLLFIPGWTFSSSVWSAQLDAFAPARRVVAIDPRSQGESSKTGDNNTPDGRARDLDEVMRALSLDNVVLVAWSQGVQDVAGYVLRFGTERIAAVVLVDAAFAPGPAATELYPQATQALLKRMGIYAAYPRDYLAGMMEAIIVRRPMPAQVPRWIDEASNTPTSTGIAMLIADLLTTDFRPAAAKLDKPTLIVAAAGSPDIAQMRALAAALPRGRLTEVADAGHAVFVDQPQEFNHLLEAFLDELRPPDSNASSGSSP